MKRIIVFFAVLLLAFTTKTLAYTDNETQKIASSSGADALKSEHLTADELSGDKSINVYEKLIEIVINSIKDSGKSVIKPFGVVACVIIICCVMHSLKLDRGEAIDAAVSYISVLALAGAVGSVLYNLFVFVIASMQSLVTVITSLLPVMASLYSFGGSVATAAASSAGFGLFLSVLIVICNEIILPLLQISFVFCLSGAMPAGVNLSSVTNLIKNATTVILSFVFTALGFALYFQTTVAAAGDSFVARSVKFASGVFVPIIGGMLGEASRTVISSVSLIKGTVGAAGVVLVLSVTVPPLIITVLYKLMLLCCATLSKSLGCERESALLYDLGNVISVLLALVIGAGVVCIIGISCFVSLGVKV